MDVRAKHVRLLHTSVLQISVGLISLFTIPAAVREKYNLEIGMISPFSRALIVA